MSELNMVLCRCPKCGNEPEVIVNEDSVNERYLIRCSDPECVYKRKGFGPFKRSAIQMWNDRVTIKSYTPSDCVRRI